VDVIAYTAGDEVPGRYRVRDDRGRVFMVSADHVVDEVGESDE